MGTERTGKIPALLLAAGLLLVVAPDSARAGTRIVDACSYITGWEPARIACYDIWKRFCPMIADGGASAQCSAAIEDAKAGRTRPPSEKSATEEAESDNAGTQVAKPRSASASSTDEETGLTTTSERNADGSRTVTVTDSDGKVVSKETVPSSSRPSITMTDPASGISTTSVRNTDGSRTITRTDAEGNELSSRTVSGDEPAEASSTDPSGTTARSVRNADGSRTITVADADGNAISTRTEPAPGKRQKAEIAEKPAKANPAPQGAALLADFCAQIADGAGKDNCYGFGQMVKTMCQLIGDPNGKEECLRITASMPERLGPYD